MHGLHVSLPSSSWKVPAAHLLHEPMPELAWAVPAAQGVCCVLPVDA